MRADDRLETLGWDAGWEAAFAPFAAEGRPPGASSPSTEPRRARRLRATGSASVSGVPVRPRSALVDFPTVGDWVAIEATTSCAPPAAAERFKRMAPDASRRGARLDDEQIMAANIDVALLVAGLDNDFNLRRIERYLAVAWSSEINPVVVLNKSDLADDVDGRLVAVEAIAPGVATVAVSARTGAGLDTLRGHLRAGTTAAILGSSGVGKSTLVNALLGEERQATAEVRDSDSRGRHTTTHRELFELPGGALLVDTPGIRSLEVLGADEGVEARSTTSPTSRRLPVQRLPARGRAGLRVLSAIDDGRLSADRLTTPPQARARSRAGTCAKRPAGASRAPPPLDGHPEDRRRSHAAKVRRREVTTTTSRIRPARTAGAPAIPGSGSVLHRRFGLRAPGRAVSRGQASGRGALAPDRRAGPARLRCARRASPGGGRRLRRGR
jgi:ribosome biogenesis GTPase